MNEREQNELTITKDRLRRAERRVVDLENRLDVALEDALGANARATQMETALANAEERLDEARDAVLAAVGSVSRVSERARTRAVVELARTQRAA